MTNAPVAHQADATNDRPWIDAVPSLMELGEYQQQQSDPSWDDMTALLACQYPLHAAAYFNHADICAHLLHHYNDNGAIVDIKTDRRTQGGETALHVACAAGHVDVAHVLVQQGHANVHELCAAGWSPLRKAVKGGHARTVMYLLERCGVATPETVLMVMIGKDYNPQRQRGLVNILLRHKVNLKCRDHRFNSLNTIFHIAAQGKQHELLELLLQHAQGDDDKHDFLESVNQNGDTPLSHLWLSSMDVPEDSVEEDKGIATARVLLQAGANVQIRQEAADGASLLHTAVSQRRIALLLEYGMDINKTLDKQGRTPLNYRAFLNKSFDAYLEHGADVTIADAEDLLPLHWICFHRNQTGLRQLLQLPETRGADANATYGSCHRTALHILAMADPGHVDKDLSDCIQILLEHHANLNAVDTDCGWTTLHHAAFQSLPLPVVEVLLANGADVSIRDKAGRTALHLVGPDFKYPHNARLQGLVESLVPSRGGCSADDSEECAKQLLHLGYLDVGQAPIKTLRLAQALVAHGASAVALDSLGNLPFFFAAYLERVDATFVLIKTAAHQGLFLGNLHSQSV